MSTSANLTVKTTVVFPRRGEVQEYIWECTDIVGAQLE